jgi:mRNA interferase RelE/StbE
VVIKYSKQAYKYLKKLHKPKREQIISAIENIPNGNIIKLKGYNDLYRLRVNDYRVIYTQEFEIIKVEKIGSRGDIYND